ncbi:MAG: ATP-binding protein [Bacilli bacterium]|nr:ATP-binding protein [Bacilli bacterium]
MFIGREKELKAIANNLKLDSLKCVLVYGRRRIGKTELINEAIRLSNKPCLSLLARKVQANINLEDFVQETKPFIDQPGFNPKSFYDYFVSLLEYSKEHPFICFVDEFCFLKENDDSIDSTIQKALELHGKSAKMTLILCGSYVDTMKQLIDKSAPLYGRFHEIIDLHVFDYYDSAKFYSTLPNEEKVKYYSVFGGTAFNIIKLDYSKSFEENLIETFVANESFFEKEVNLVLMKELQKEERANTLFELIAGGVRKYKDLNDRMGDPSKDNVGRYLKKLEELDLIKKSFSVNAKSERKPLYYINDGLLDFYYTYLAKTKRIRSIMDPRVFFEHYVKEDLYSKYIPRRFEQITAEYLIRNNGKNKAIGLFDSIGRLFYSNNKDINREYDVVINTENGIVPFECKFTASPIDESVVKEEKNSFAGLPFEVYKYGFVSKSGFTDSVKNDSSLILLELDDLYE